MTGYGEERGRGWVRRKRKPENSMAGTPLARFGPFPLPHLPDPTCLSHYRSTWDSRSRPLSRLLCCSASANTQSVDVFPIAILQTIKFRAAMGPQVDCPVMSDVFLLCKGRQSH